MAQPSAATTMKMASIPLLPLKECSRSNFDAPTLLPRWSCEASNDIFSKREAPSMTSRRVSPTPQGKASCDLTANERPAQFTVSTDLFVPLQGPSIIFLDAHCLPTCIANHPRPPPIANLKPRKQPKRSSATPESEETSVSHLCFYKQSNGAILTPNNAQLPNHPTNAKRGNYNNLPKFPSLSTVVADDNTGVQVSFSKAVPKKRCRGAAPMLPVL